MPLNISYVEGSVPVTIKALKDARFTGCIGCPHVQGLLHGRGNYTLECGIFDRMSPRAAAECHYSKS
jgi:hypothetical protein